MDAVFKCIFPVVQFKTNQLHVMLADVSEAEVWMFSWASVLLRDAQAPSNTLEASGNAK